MQMQQAAARKRRRRIQKAARMYELAVKQRLIHGMVPPAEQYSKKVNIMLAVCKIYTYNARTT